MSQNWNLFLDDVEQNYVVHLPNLLPFSLAEDIGSNCTNEILFSSQELQPNPLMESEFESCIFDDETNSNFQQNGFIKTSISYPYVMTRPKKVKSNKIKYYNVQFHHHRTQVVKDPNHLYLTLGDYVITEADRGYDIGRIIDFAPDPFMIQSENIDNINLCDINQKPNPSTDCLIIIRKALQNEIDSLSEKEENEKKATLICQQKAREFGLPMTITSTEFQFDGKKLTVYFKADKYIDFRNLVHSLFKIFGTRIWMVWYDGDEPVKDVFTHIDNYHYKIKNHS